MEKKRPQLETRKLKMGKLTGKSKHAVKVRNHPHTNMTSKPAIVRRGEYKCRILEMHLKLRDQQLKTTLYIYRLLFQNLMVTTIKNLQWIHTRKRKRNPNTTLKIVIKSQEEKTKEEGKKKDLKKTKIMNKMAIRTYILIIILNVKRLNAPTKRHRLPEWIQKQDPYICCLQETHFRSRDTYRLKVRGHKKVFHANCTKEKFSL